MTIHTKVTTTLATCLLSGAMSVAQAEDIDLFSGPGVSANTEVPNVLIIVDNTANWTSAFTNEMKALASTFAGLPADKFRVGLMLFTETGKVDAGNDGGYVRAAVRYMDSANKARYQDLIQSLDVTDDKSNGGKAGLAMVEAYRYFTGGTPHAGNQKGKTDYAGNSYGSAASKAIYALTGNALASKSATTYVSPIAAGCQRNYIIYISNGPVQDNTNDSKAAADMLRSAGGSTTAIPISPAGSQDNMADEWARWMKQSSLSVSTYTIEVDPDTKGQAPGWTALMKSTASVSGGKYFAVSSGNNGSQILDALSKTFSEIQAVNSVFAAVSLPISVNTQGTYLNQVFVGMFRPDADSFPRWAGNLKQYKMGYGNDGVLKLLDASDQAAINGQTGFIAECARSYWTPSQPDTYWNFAPQGTCIAPGVSGADTYRVSNTPDGNIVEKGGQAYKTRSATSRQVKTCSPVFAACTSLTTFNSGNADITQSALGATDTAERTALIDWARGIDLKDDNQNGIFTTEMRASVHADVVHSRPVAINFGTDAAPRVVVFYGGNDGMLRAVNGNRSAAINGSTAYDAGAELWAFMAPEFYGNIKRLRNNDTPVPVPAVAGSANTKPYGFDGAVTAYKDNARAWLYATMRRGGRALYAFNVDVNNPANVTLKWKKGCPNNFLADGSVSDDGCSAGFERLGQSWSAAKPFKAAGHAGGQTPVLIVGGGYDPCEDRDPNTCGAASKGNRIYVLDGDDGRLLQTLVTDRGVVGDVTLVRDPATGVVHYAYATDLGGNLYRITILQAPPAAWTITKVASLGCDTPDTCTNNRKFMFAPDVVVEGDTHYIMTGSGDREKPLVSYSHAYQVANHFFMIKDKPATSNWLSAEAGQCAGTGVICKASLLGIATNGAAVSPTALSNKKGWYLALTAHEQVVTTSVTLFGTVTFSTHQPAVPQPGSCNSNLGIANVFNIRYADAAPANGTTRYQRISGDGLPPSPVAGRVTLDNGRTVPFVIGSSASSPLEAREGDPGSAAVAKPPKRRVYWQIKQ
ncbi:pilus assembly protein [Noviherbaspirillum malthae]|uniref:pilus assembly protein n=1 Tax=Noviherbaspirillum malthae TaxID=1260987 RepID=UPI00188DEA13|nr:PilC/PilY family type IV pilus protein [Noviherbaspirillum malthae]